MRHRNHKQRIVSIAGALLLIFTSSSCNMFERLKLDKAKTDEEILIDARAKMDEGRCAEAAQAIEKMTTRLNEAHRLHGWAQLCAGGAGLKKVLTTLVSFTSSTNNLDAVGTLASAIAPQSDVSIAYFTSALDSFGKQDPSNDKNLNLMLGFLIKASAYLAKAARDGKKVTRADISPTGCVGVDCTTGSAACTSVNMPDTDADAFRDTITQAGTNIAAGLGAVGDLTGGLTGKIPAGAASALTRCVIVNSLLRE